jgi:Protein of unknown function (DUF3047)
MTTSTWPDRRTLTLAAALAAVLAALLAAAGAWAQSERIAVALFSMLKPGAALPEAWKPLQVRGVKHPTRYTLVEEDGATVVRADAAASAAGLSRAIRVDLVATPLLKWRWKITNILKASDIRTKQGDDFPARVYVMFDYPLEKLPFAERTRIRLARAFYDPHIPAATLCYVWDGKAPAGTIAESAYTSRVRMVVVESGDARVNRWLDVERNVAADFKAAFGDDAPPVMAVAIATDTDNTGESATAFFGDIFFYKHIVTR